MNKNILARILGCMLLTFLTHSLSAQSCSVPPPSITSIEVLKLKNTSSCGRGGRADNVQIYAFYDHIPDTNTCGYWFGTKPKTCKTDPTQYYSVEHTLPFQFGHVNYETLDFWHNNVGTQFEFSVDRWPNANGPYSGCLPSTTRVSWSPGASMAWVVLSPAIGSPTGYWVSVNYHN